MALQIVEEITRLMIRYNKTGKKYIKVTEAKLVSGLPEKQRAMPPQDKMKTLFFVSFCAKNKVKKPVLVLTN